MNIIKIPKNLDQIEMNYLQINLPIKGLQIFYQIIL